MDSWNEGDSLCEGVKVGGVKGEVYDLGGQHWLTINLHLREGA